MSAAPSRDQEGYYATPVGRFMSVTTIISLGVPKPALFHWAAYEAASCAVENVPALVKARGDEARKELRGWIQRAAERKRDTAADLGSFLHSIFEARILGAPTPEMSDEQALFVPGFDRFLNDWQPEYEATELTVANTGDEYAGTLDFIGTLPALGPDMLLGDYKTGKNVYPEVGLQLSAYRRAEIGWTRPAGVEVKPPATSGGVVVQIRPKDLPGGTVKGYSIRHVQTGDDVYRVFLAAKQTAAAMRQGGLMSEILGSPLAAPKMEKVA